MSSPTILYQFEFTGNYSETVFMQSPYASDILRPLVQAAVASEITFLTRFKGVNAISKQVTDPSGNLFKVKLSRV
jgi:hypothetical protein